jgi:hypothetical protein
LNFRNDNSIGLCFEFFSPVKGDMLVKNGEPKSFASCSGAIPVRSIVDLIFANVLFFMKGEF